MRQAMHAGRLRDRVRIEVPAPAGADAGQDSGGQPVPDWAEVATVWACVDPVALSTLIRDGLRSVASEVVTVRRNPAVLAAGSALRVVVLTRGNRVLEAVGVQDDPQKQWLTIPCKASEGATA